MALRKSTRIWIGLFVLALAATAIQGSGNRDLGCFGVITAVLAFVSGAVLVVLASAAAFRAIMRRLTLRLAFSYFLIGIVPIPLLAMLLFTASYLLAHQFMATRVRREVTSLTEALASPETAPLVKLRDGAVESSGVEWLKPGDPAAWAKSLDVPRPVIAGNEIWIATRRRPEDSGEILLVSVSGDPEFRRRLADATGYSIRIESGTATQGPVRVERTSGKGRGHGFQVNTRPVSSVPGAPAEGFVRPRGSAAPGAGVLDREWVSAVYVDKALFKTGGPEKKSEDSEVVVYVARTSPRTLADQLFAQGVPGVARVFRIVFLLLAFCLLLVYLIALAIAFGLVGSITRSVNRLTRASRAVSGGDFSVRVNSKSQDQIGDLARSFDGMAGSIERLMVETAKKERLEGEIAVARTIQQKLLPDPEVSFPGLSIAALFEPLAEIGGDYYDYFPMPDGRTAVVVGDVSGHGLPTGLLVAMAKAGLSTLIDSGLTGSALFARLNELIHRSTDARNYMTLSLLAFDPRTRRAELTNAGQLAPYRLSAGGLESLSLPSFPLGATPRADFPTMSYELAAGDRLVFATDGFVEAMSASGEPFGFERLEALLSREAASDAGRLKEAILEAVGKHTKGAAPEDDRTLVVLTVG